jgi:hypothetical protein
VRACVLWHPPATVPSSHPPSSRPPSYLRPSRKHTVCFIICLHLRFHSLGKWHRHASHTLHGDCISSYTFTQSFLRVQVGAKTVHDMPMHPPATVPSSRPPSYLRPSALNTQYVSSTASICSANGISLRRIGCMGLQKLLRKTPPLRYACRLLPKKSA